MKASHISYVGKRTCLYVKLHATISASVELCAVQVWRQLLPATGKRVLGPSKMSDDPVVDFIVLSHPAKSESAYA